MEHRRRRDQREARRATIRRAPSPRHSEDKLTETIRQRLEHLVPELVKKTFAAGMGAVFSTEEGIRKHRARGQPARCRRLRRVVGATAPRTRSSRSIARETREFLANLNLTEEIAKILTTLSFEIKTEIRFIPNSERLTGAEPDVKASVRLKRNDKPLEKDEGGGEEAGRSSRLRFWRRDGAANDDGDEK